MAFLDRPIPAPWAHVAALVLGALTPLSLAPANLWPIGILCSTLFAGILQHTSGKQGLWRGFFFGAGLYGSGASWVYISIHDFGMTSAPLALVLTSFFVLGLALVFALPFFFYARFFSRSTWGLCTGFAAIWTLGEWIRSWLLTGFPWLYIGYGHIETWLAGWAPLLGVFGLSFLAVLSGMLLFDIIAKLLQRNLTTHALSTILIPCAIFIFIWIGGFVLHNNLWQDDDQTQSISVAIVQPNIPLEKKWNPVFREEIMGILREQTEQHLDKDLIIWPEAAVPIMYHDAEYLLDEMDTLGKANNTGIILGILYDDDKPYTFYNSITGVGRAQGIYFKQRLVPFGEYVPLERWLRGLIAFFDLPNSIIFPGPPKQEILRFDKAKIAPSICYEIVYPDLVAKQALEADLLVTISNDAWFGESIGPLQHFQMAQMRALENRRFVIRGTNTGLSGIINPRGEVVLLGSQFTLDTFIHNKVGLVNQSTFFSRWGSAPIVLFCCLIILIYALAQARQRQRRVVSLPD